MAGQINIAAVIPEIGKDLELVTLPVPTPGPNDVLIRTAIVGVNPIDRVRQLFGFQVPTVPKVIGSDTTGVVVGVGSEAAKKFKIDDRVIAVTDGFATGDNARESYQTYALAPALTTTKLPDDVTFIKGSTVSLVTMTAATVFFEGFKFSIPGSKDVSKPLPRDKPVLVIWGGATSVGSMAIQLARILGFTVFATASPRHHERLQKLGAEVVVDYSDPAAAVEALLKAAGNRQIQYAIDTISDPKTTTPSLEAILLQSAKATSSPSPAELAHIGMIKDFAWKDGYAHTFVNATVVWSQRQDIGEWLFGSGNLSNWLADGTLVPPPARIIDGGLHALQTALNQAKDGVSGEKLVVEVK